MGVARRLVPLVLGAAALLLIAGADAFIVTPVTVGTNVDITKLSGDDAEATIAINPANPKQVFTVVNPALARRSTNGGQTWKKAGQGIAASCCDNAAAWDDFGNLFVTNIPDSLEFIPLYLSKDGGNKFKKLLDLNSSTEVDQPTVKTGDGMVWATWNEDFQIVARGAAVTGLGHVGGFIARRPLPGSRAAFPQIPRRPGVKQPAPGSSGDGGQFGDIAIGPGAAGPGNGPVVVDWQTETIPGPCPCAIRVNTDPDGLGVLGFGSAVTAVTDTHVEKFRSLPAQPNRTVDAEANLAYDRSGLTHNGRLYLVYTAAPTDVSNDTDIKLKHSDDNGATWSSAITVNDDGATGKSQFLPYLAVDQTTGNLIVTWYDSRNSVSNDTAEYWGALSVDGGATFEPNFKISTGVSNSNLALDTGFEFGDYSWVDFVGGLALPVWSDNSNSTGNNPDGANSGLDLYTARIQVAFCGGLPATIIGTTNAGETINGTPGNDVILGLDGNDTIVGGGGKDVICGGDGNDTFDEGASPNGSDTFFGGPGTDTVDYSGRTGNVTVLLDGKAGSGEKGEKDAISSDVENALGGAGNDKLTGSASANVLTGGPGKDMLRGGAGADTLNATDGIGGNDSVDGGKDADVDTCNVDPGDKVKRCP